MKITFSEEEIKRLNKINVQAELNKEYTKEETNKMFFKANDFIYSQSTKNDDIPKLLNNNADLLDKLRGDM